MSRALLEKFTEERTQVAEYVARTLEGVEGRDLNEAELRSVQESKTRIEALDAQIKPLAEFMASRNSAADLTSVLNRAPQTRAVETRSWGEQFVESDVYTGYTGRGTSGRLTIEQRALPHTLTGLAAALPPPSRYDLTAPPPPSPLLDLIDTIPVSQNSVETIIWEKVAGGAEVVPEGQMKPSVEYAPTVAAHPLQTLAVWTSATRQLLSDSAAIRAMIDTQLRREVTQAEEREAALAVGAAPLPAVTGDNLLEAIRISIGTVQSEGYFPNAVLLNPADWASLDIEVWNGGSGGSAGAPSSRNSFWGLTPVASASQPAGEAIVGDWSAGAQRFVRMGVSLFATDSDQSDFLLNVVKILAESRQLTLVSRPAAFAVASIAPVIP